MAGSPYPESFRTSKKVLLVTLGPWGHISRNSCSLREVFRQHGLSHGVSINEEEMRTEIQAWGHIIKHVGVKVGMHAPI